jgi:endonuclease G, mitochondrial
MKNADKVVRLKEMLKQVAPEEGNVESIPRRSPSPIELESAASGLATATATVETAALDKLKLDREDELDSEEVFALEAIILPDRRPVVLVRDGKYDDLGDPWTPLNAADIRNRLTPLIRSIGRIELPNIPAIPYGGTGFVVGPELMMTNRHVARLFAEGLGTTIRYRAGDAAVDFLRESGMPEPESGTLLKVVGVEMIHPFWDMALLRVEGLEDKFPPLPLSVRPPEQLNGEDVVVIGYPARDDRNDLDVQDQVFNRTYNVKRLQPGMVRQRARIRSFENQVNALTHDSSTLGGNSGSAVIDVKTGKVVGLHFAGIYLKSNYAVPTYELARDARVTRLGLNFEGSVRPTNDWNSSWQAAGSEQAKPGAAPAELRSSSSWTIPIRVDISLGAPQTDAPGPMAAAGSIAAATEAMKVPVIVGDLEGRSGYQSAFLGLTGSAKVPLPTVTPKGEAVVAELADGSYVLKYHKFSIVVHGERRLALFTAANVDWRAEMRLIRGRKPTRKQLTGLNDGDVERWASDHRVDAEQQLPDAFFTKDGGAFDKGHLVRRDDVVWGKNFKDMQKANGDTYHTTNCSPQVQSFNQGSRGEDNWGDLESLVQSQTKTEKAMIFSGPVFEADDPIFDGKDGEGGSIRLRIPRRYWKVIVVKEKTSAGAYGFMLEQDLSDVPTVEEFAVPSEWKQHMESIADIEASLGGLLDLEWLKKHDRFGSDDGEAIAQALE